MLVSSGFTSSIIFTAVVLSVREELEEHRKAISCAEYILTSLKRP